MGRRSMCHFLNQFFNISDGYKVSPTWPSGSSVRPSWFAEKEFHVSFPGALERVGNDDAVLDLSEDVGRIFSITSDNLTINFWPPVLLAAVVVISEWELLENWLFYISTKASELLNPFSFLYFQL